MLDVVRRALSGLGLLAACAPGMANADYVFQRIDYQVVNGTLIPGGNYTQTWGINDNGQVAMLVLDEANNPVGYVYQPATGAFTRLPDPPAALFTDPLGINNAGTVTGSVYPPDASFQQGFVLQNGTYRLFSNIGWPFTVGRAIGNDGLVTGVSFTADGTGVGFIYDPGTSSFTNFAVPGSVATLAQGRNAAGQVVGSGYGGPSFSQPSGFLREPNGTITSFRINDRPTAARGINDEGLIVGWVVNSEGQRVFVGNANGYQVLTCPPEICPGLVSIAGQGINNLGQIVGPWFDNSLTAVHAFIATPVSLPSGTTAGGAYVFSIDVVADKTIFIDPKLAVGYDYVVGNGDPLFASVRLPFGIGDNQYTLLVGGRSFKLAANETFDFAAHGFAGGVARFRVAEIEEDAALDPNNSLAFPTGLTFVDAGRFTGTMTPLCRPGAMPAQAKAPAGRALVACGAH